MELVDETFRKLLQKVWHLWRQEMFMSLDENFAINLIRPFIDRYNSHRRDRKSQKIFVKGAHPVIQRLCITLKRSLAYSEFTMHL